MQRADFHFFEPFRVRYAETDMQKVVFYGNYSIYYDVAITEYFRALGFDQMAHLSSTDEDFHVVKSTQEFKGSAVFDDKLDVGVRTAKLGRSSITFDAAIFRQGEDAPINVAEIVWVNANQKTRTSAPMPQELIDKVKAFERGKLG
ncbi:MAG: acyl-CoA thioesterase [Alphaproteobacteria bacterium]